MENSPLTRLRYLFVLAILFGVVFPATAQQKQSKKSYKINVAPDLWFNSVDGIRAGIRIRGEKQGMLRKGPHRLDAGLWLSTFFPTYPVSYFISFTEPIPAISGLNSEGNIQLRSSIRTGYDKHVISFNKRWQPGFNETNYRELSVNFRAEKRFEDEYLLYPEIWQNNWLYLAGLNFVINNNNPIGRYRLKSSTSINFAGSYSSFINTTLELQQYIPFSNYSGLHFRFFTGLSSNNTAPEYLFSHSFKPYTAWDHLGITRAKGTIPSPWVRKGIIQVEGGANLRGYTNEDIEQLNEGGMPLLNSISAINIELEYPNPINESLDKIPFAGLFNLQSYIFYDGGTSLGISAREEGRFLSDAGLGFKLSLNIPDYLGKSRGFALRYEIPLWLSHPYQDDPTLKFRSLLGIGAVISL